MSEAKIPSGPEEVEHGGGRNQSMVGRPFPKMSAQEKQPQEVQEDAAKANVTGQGPANVQEQDEATMGEPGNLHTVQRPVSAEEVETGSAGNMPAEAANASAVEPAQKEDIHILKKTKDLEAAAKAVQAAAENRAAEKSTVEVPATA